MPYICISKQTKRRTYIYTVTIFDETLPIPLRTSMNFYFLFSEQYLSTIYAKHLLIDDMIISLILYIMPEFLYQGKIIVSHVLMLI